MTDNIRKGMLVVVNRNEAESYDLDDDEGKTLEMMSAFKDIKSIQKHLEDLTNPSNDYEHDNYDDPNDSKYLNEDLIVYELVPRYTIERKLVITDLNKSTTTSSSVKKKTEIDLYED